MRTPDQIIGIRGFFFVWCYVRVVVRIIVYDISSTEGYSGIVFSDIVRVHQMLFHY